ncbi:MAG: sulfotransferase family protein [Phenylobacterium sp.]|nr:MAG: sulfotransferase family protein [Phenylobacterium sp.]
MDRESELLRAGRFDEAIAHAVRRTQGTPQAPEAWLALAQAQLAARRPEAALAASDAGLTAAPGDAPLLCAKAGVLRSLSRVDEATALYRQVLTREPDHFDAGFGVTLLAVEAGDWAGAETWLRRLAAAHPGRPDLQWLGARAAVGLGDLDRARGDLIQLSRDPRLAPDQRADVLLLLGEALDGLGRAREAFAAAAEGKTIQRRLYAERAAGREGAAERFARLAAWFAAADPAPWRTAPAPPRTVEDPAAHLFLVGFPRSGTTLLEQALAGHPQVVSLEEAPTLAAAHAEFLGSAEGLARLAVLSESEAQPWRARYWAEVAAHGLDPAGRVFLDKAPAGTEDLPLVAKLFPKARVLFAIRDPRDVVLSCLRQNFQMNALTYAFTDLASAAQAYAGCMALAEVYRTVLPVDLHEVRHEALLDDFAGGLAKICQAIGLAFDPAMADPAATARRRTVRTPSAPQVRAGLNRQGVGRWRSYAPGLAPVLPILDPWVRRLGYEV